MDSRTLLIATLAILLFVSVGTSLYLYTQRPAATADSIPMPDLSQYTPRPEPYKGDPQLVEADLYFLTPDYIQLTVEQRQIQQPPILEDRVRIAIEELIEGPVRSPDLINPIPPGTQLQSVFWVENEGRIYLSFTPTLLSDKPTHALAEWGLIYCIVNTAIAQSPIIKEVQILVDGQIVQSSETIWDWSLPFQKEETFVKFTLEGNL